MSCGGDVACLQGTSNGREREEPVLGSSEFSKGERGFLIWRRADLYSWARVGGL